MRFNPQEFTEANRIRCEASFHPLNDWSPTDWGCALGGETGELQNMLKKMKRGEHIPIEKLENEVGDIYAYLDLTCSRLGINIGKAIIDKFNIVSDRVGSPIKL